MSKAHFSRRLLACLGLLALGAPALADIDVSLLRELAGQTSERAVTASAPAAGADEADAWFRRGNALDKDNASAAEQAEAAKWYLRAAERGHAGAQTNLGLMYLEGQGVPADAKEAQRWLRRGAEAGNVAAQYSLALLYHQGHGVVRDFGEAMYWYESAARQGNAGAMNNLAIMHGMGEGVPQSNVEAYAWFAMAARHGDSNAEENRDVTANEMSADDRDKAKARALELENQIKR